MRIYLANHSSAQFFYLQGKYDRLGWLLGPKSFKITKLRNFVPIAFDNDAFTATEENPWDEKAWLEMLDEIRKRKLNPEFVLAPDVVGNKEETLRRYRAYSCYLHGFKIALAVQDGMVPQDIPVSVDYIFLGGSLKWKWKSLNMWTMAFPGRVHVGRVNRVGKLIACQRSGAISVDGTGWFRRPPEEWMRELTYFFERQNKKQMSLF